MIQRFALFSSGLSILFVVLGVGLDKFAQSLAWAVHWRDVAYSISPQTLCLGVAAFFCALATLYSVTRMPFDKAVISWHFWISLCCVTMYALSQLVFVIVMKDRIPQKSMGSVAFAIVIPNLVAPIFLLSQLLMVYELVHVFLKLRIDIVNQV